MWEIYDDNDDTGERRYYDKKNSLEPGELKSKANLNTLSQEPLSQFQSELAQYESRYKGNLTLIK